MSAVSFYFAIHHRLTTSRFAIISARVHVFNRSIRDASSLAKGYDSGPLLSTLGRSRIHLEDSRFNISLVTATSTRIQSEDVLYGAHVIDEM